MFEALFFLGVWRHKWPRQESKKCGNDFNFIVEVEEFLPVLLTTALIPLFLSDTSDVISCWSELQQHGGIDSELRL
jgi:hypothetical protein